MIRYIFIFLLSFVRLFSLEQEDPWVLLIKQYGKEKVLVRFPEDPVLKVPSNQTSLFISEVQGEKYLLKMEQREEREKREVFDQILQRIEEAKELALFDVKEKDNSKKTYIETKVQASNSMFIESRTYVTKEHIFTLESQYPLNTKSSHKDFVNSFQII